MQGLMRGRPRPALRYLSRCSLSSLSPLSSHPTHGHVLHTRNLGSMTRLSSPFASSLTRSAPFSSKPGEQEGKEQATCTSSGSETKDTYPSILAALGCHPDNLKVDHKTFNRWLMLPPAVLNHLCLGSVFAWSIFNAPLTQIYGVVAPAASDWVLSEVSFTFSLVMGGFVWGGLLGRYLEAWGPRACVLIGASCLGSGFGLASLAVATHSLPTLYAGGVVWGFANGWAYVPPVATLLKWFPDRKGFASASCLVGFGGGAMIAAPLFTKLPEMFRTAPEYLGPSAAVDLVNEGGKLFAAGREVIVACAADARLLGLDEGVYVVGTGSTGLAETFGILGMGYCAVMACCSMMYREPDRPLAQPVGATTVITTHNVDPAVATATPQFWLMWTGFGLSITGTYGIISCGRNILMEGFGGAYPELVTSAFAVSFVSGMSAANLGGRLFWANLSDYVARFIGGDPFYGRRWIFGAMWGMGPPLYLAVIWSIHNATSESLLPLAVFCGSVFGIMSGFGGTAATRPPFAGDLFGTKHVGILTARQLTCILPAAMLGPKIATWFRANSINDAIADLSTRVDESAFTAAFGAGKEHLDTLVAQKTVTIGRLLELCPPETIDPAPFVYDNTMYCMATLQGMAFFTNLMMKPVDPALHEIEEPDQSKENEEVGEAEDAEEVEEAEEADKTDERKSGRKKTRRVD